VYCSRTQSTAENWFGEDCLQALSLGACHARKRTFLPGKPGNGHHCQACQECHELRKPHVIMKLCHATWAQLLHSAKELPILFLFLRNDPDTARCHGKPAPRLSPFISRESRIEISVVFPAFHWLVNRVSFPRARYACQIQGIFRPGYNSS
jgi:hypothetical protein